MLDLCLLLLVDPCGIFVAESYCCLLQVMLVGGGKRWLICYQCCPFVLMLAGLLLVDILVIVGWFLKSWWLLFCYCSFLFFVVIDCRCCCGTNPNL